MSGQDISIGKNKRRGGFMLFRKTVPFITILLAVWMAAALAAIPQKMNYQGKLTDSAGNPENGSFDMVFSIYTAGTGGSLLWSEPRTGVPVNKGIYSLVLGEGTPITTEVFDGSERWLGVKVEGDAEMEPRMKIVSVANAYHAYTADTLAGSSGGYVLKAGDTMGSVDTSTSLNRFRYNMPEGFTPESHSVLSLGGETDGSLATLGLPAGFYSSQIFAQAKDDGTAAYNYFGLWGRADARRSNAEAVGILGEAYSGGDTTYAIAAIGGTDTQNITGICAVSGYADTALDVVNSSATGMGLSVNAKSTDNDVARFQYDGADILNVQDDRTVFPMPAYFGDGYISSYNDDSYNNNLALYNRYSIYSNILATGYGGWAINCDGNYGLNVYTNASGDSPLMLSVPSDGSSACLSGYVPNEDSQVGIVLDNYYSLDGFEGGIQPKLVSFRTAGVEKAYIGGPGDVHTNSYFSCDSGGSGGLYLNGRSSNEVIYSSGPGSIAGWEPSVVIQSGAEYIGGETPPGFGVAVRNYPRLDSEYGKLFAVQYYTGGEVPWEDSMTIYADNRARFAGLLDCQNGLDVYGTSTFESEVTFNTTVDATAAGIKMWQHTPTSTEAGAVGLMCYDSSYLYLWTGNSTVKRVALSNW
jgi:hypothetical protein